MGGLPPDVANGEGESEGFDPQQYDEFGRPLELLAWQPIDFGLLTAAGREACHELFRRGDVSWLLHPGQQRMLDWIDQHEREIAVVVTSRQFGKSVAALLYCLLYCIRHPKATVCYMAPYRSQLKEFILPKINFIFQFMPDDLLPMKRGDSWTFSNGAMLRCDGISMGHGARMRGTSLDLVVLDECRDVSQLQAVIDAHISPCFTTTQGRLVMVSTPPESPLHAFTEKYIKEAIERNDLFLATYRDNPLLSTRRLRYLMRVQHPGGEKNVVFRREYLADWTVTDPEKRVVREWDQKANDAFFDNYEGAPAQVRGYVGVDYAHSDPCGIVAGYFDWKCGALIITHEHAERGMNADDVGIVIQQLERDVRTSVPRLLEPIRICDVNPGLCADMWSRFQLRLEPAFKPPSILTMLNKLRSCLLDGRLRIHPRCTNLRWQLAAGVFKSGRADTMEYQRSERGGHLDLIDAVKYVVGNMRWHEMFHESSMPTVGPNQIMIGGFSAPTFKSGVQRPR